MNERRWPRIKRILSRAVAFEQISQRRIYVEEACGDDASLRAEVESLLRDQDQGQGPLSIFDSLTGQRLGPYQLIERIGRGLATAVYKAQDTRLDRVVVVKVLPPTIIGQEESRRRFLQEAKCLAALSHPHIAHVHDIGFDRGVNFIVMEHVRGRKLHETIPSRGLPFRQYLDHAMQIADALVAAHAVGIIHRDVKPSNVLVTTEGGVKLIDFGLAKGVAARSADGSEPATEPGTILGTIGYMSPEQVRGVPADARSDVFCFGAVLYQMATGIPPFKRPSAVESMAAILNEEPPTASRVPTPILQIVGRCLKKNPADRFQSMNEVRSALGSISEAAHSPACRPRTALSNRFGRQKRPLALAALVVLAVSLRGAWRPRLNVPGPVESSAKKANAARVIVQPAQFTGPDGGWAMSVILEPLRAAMQEDPDIEIAPAIQPIHSSRDADARLKEAAQQSASLLIWGETIRTSERDLVSSHVAIVDQDPGFSFRHPITTITLPMIARDPIALEARVGSLVRYLSLLMAGVRRYNAHEWNSAIGAFTRATDAPAQTDLVDVDTARFYRALAYTRMLKTGSCQQPQASGCDVDGALRSLRRAVQDFDVILERRPDHGNAHWNRGLAYENICALESRAGHPAQGFCDAAIRDFGDALKVPLSNDNFFVRLPDEASVLFNRAYTHLLEARLPTLARSTRLSQFDTAIHDFDHLLAGGTRYASFLNKRRQELISYRQLAEKERAALAGGSES